jgi:GAF domain-containing protein
MSQDWTVSDRFAAYAAAMHDAPTVTETLEAVLDHARHALGCRYVAVMFIHGGNRIEVAAATDPVLEQLDQVQVDFDTGPDLDALSRAGPLLINDLERETRWPQWLAAIRPLGVRSLLAIPLTTDVITVGTLNFYDPEPDRFDRGDVAIAHIFARHAAVALATARNLENIWQAVDARKIVGQAQGILMERYQLTAEQALAVLMRYSRDTNTKLHLVARTVIDDRTLPATDTR